MGLTIASFALLFYYYYGYTTDAGVLGQDIAAEDHVYHIFFIGCNILLHAHYYSIATEPWHRVLLKYYIFFRFLAVVYRVAAWSFNLVLVWNTPVYLAMALITVAATRTTKEHGRKDAVNYRARYAFQFFRNRVFARVGEVRAGTDGDTTAQHTDRGAARKPKAKTPDKPAAKADQ